MKRRINILFIAIIIIGSSIAYGEIGIESQLRAYILADFETGEILEEYNIREAVEIASISKIMTYLVVMDEVTKGNISLDDRLIIDEDTASIGGSSLKLKAGEIFRVEELLEASMVVSANDATYALAKHIAGNEPDFAMMMNQKAGEIGLENARFYNSTGLPIAERDVQNIMTTEEIFLLSKYIIENYPQVLDITKKPAIEVFARDYFERNTNPLLGELPEVDGFKTGFTNKAGYCYVSTFNLPGQENISKDGRLISIVMGARGLNERNRLGRVLVEYGLDNYSNRIFFHEDLPLTSIEIPKGQIKQLEVYPVESFSKLVKDNGDFDISLDLKEKIRFPIRKGEKLGSAVLEEDGQVIFRTDIISNEKVKRESRLKLLVGYLTRAYNMIMGRI